jgi:CheY-like chemotaxis protein
MAKNSISVLLAGDDVGQSPKLLRWLQSRGCSCHFASSYRNVCQLLLHAQFDLVLCQYHLPDRTAFPLLDLLGGSSATLFFSTRVENGSLWLPMLERGERRIGTPLVLSSDLILALDKVLSDTVKSREASLAPAVGLRPSCA